MNFLNQLFALPYADIWIPGAIFIVVVTALVWFMRSPRSLADARSDGTPQPTLTVESSPSVQLATAALTTTPTTAGKKDLRQATRRKGNPVDVHIATPENKKTPYDGSVLDRTTAGLRIAARREIDVGTILSIRPVSADEMVPWVDIEVRSCRASAEFPGEFELGCQFVKAPPYSILLLFG